MLKLISILVLLILFPVIGIGIIISSIGMLQTAKAAQKWPTVQGKIISSEVFAEMRSQSNRTGTREKPVEVYSAKVQYEYVVDGKIYRGQRLSLQDGPSTDRHQAELTARKFDTKEATVYYNPENPQDALLIPEKKGDIIIGIVFGVVLLIVPNGLILVGLYYQLIPMPDLPTWLQLWWDLKFGKYKNSAAHTQLVDASDGQPLSSDETMQADVVAPNEDQFIESFDTWDPANRIEIVLRPEAVWVYLFVSVLVGLIIAWVCMFPVAHLVYGRENPHLPELGSVFGILLLASSSILFLVCRFSNRGSKTVIDCRSRIVESSREFAFSRQYKISDVQRVVVQCVPVKGRHRKFRAIVELDVGEGTVAAASTREPRRKQESAQERALTLAEPLASALGVPVEFEGWDSP